MIKVKNIRTEETIDMVGWSRVRAVTLCAGKSVEDVIEGERLVYCGEWYSLKFEAENGFGKCTIPTRK